MTSRTRPAPKSETRRGRSSCAASSSWQKKKKKKTDDIERKAVLAPTGVDADAGGEAEVEFSKNAPAIQEIEFAVRNVAPSTVLTFAIDGVDVATATTDGKGRAEVERDVRMPATAASR